MSMENSIPKAFTGSINLSMIDKSQIVQGKKGKYINIRAINTPESEFGQDYMIVQDIPKELREQGLKGPILGNANAFDLGEGKKAQKGGDVGATVHPRVSDDLPF